MDNGKISGRITIPQISLTGMGAGYNISTGNGSGKIYFNVINQSTFTVSSVSGSATIQMDEGSAIAIEEGILYDISDATEIIIKVSGSCDSSHEDGGWCSDSYSATLYYINIY